MIIFLICLFGCLTFRITNGDSDFKAKENLLTFAEEFVENVFDEEFTYRESAQSQRSVSHRGVVQPDHHDDTKCVNDFNTVRLGLNNTEFWAFQRKLLQRMSAKLIYHQCRSNCNRLANHLIFMVLDKDQS